MMDALKRSPLQKVHEAMGAVMAPCGGWLLPLHYQTMPSAEHIYTRLAASLFDLAQMGQIRLEGDDIAGALEKIIPCDLLDLEAGQSRRSVLLNEIGGIVDDVLISRCGNVWRLMVVAERQADTAEYLHAYLPPKTKIGAFAETILSLQGPRAGEAIRRLSAAAVDLPYMGTLATASNGIPLFISRTGYTGEDGFDISIPPADVSGVWEQLLAADFVQPAGMAARESLRIEAGFCAYGKELDEMTSPTEARINFSIGPRRRVSEDFIGAPRVLREMLGDLTRVRVGLRLEGGLCPPEGAVVLDSDGQSVGALTSSGYSSNLGTCIAMAYVPPALAYEGTPFCVMDGEKRVHAQVVALPFVPHRFFESSDCHSVGL
jgi:aminomethyltransferase